MMLIQIEVERGDNQFGPTFRFLRPEGLEAFRLIDETSWEVANSDVMPTGEPALTPHRHVPHSHLYPPGF